MTDHTDPADELRAALALRDDADVVVGAVHEGWDVYSIPHGGYLLALAGAVALHVADAPDIVTITTHYLRKTVVGDVRFRATVVGGSRRFRTLHLVGEQDGRPVLTSLVSVTDRGETSGPTTAPPPWEPVDLAPVPGTADEIPAPAIARRMRQQLDLPTVPWIRGETAPITPIRSRIATEQPDQLTALLACDVTPPAVWNTLGSQGWVPTLELTAHVRARPAPGPLRIEASTTHVTDGMLEEDALVHDATGRLVVQSRQLALWTDTA